MLSKNCITWRSCMHSQIWNSTSSGGLINVIFCDIYQAPHPDIDIHAPDAYKHFELHSLPKFQVSFSLFSRCVFRVSLLPSPYFCVQKKTIGFVHSANKYIINKNCCLNQMTDTKVQRMDLRQHPLKR